MNREQIKRHNRNVIKQVSELVKLKLSTHYRYRLKMGYKELAIRLNAAGVFSSRGNYWTFRSLYRMMQRQGIRLYDIKL